MTGRCGAGAHLDLVGQRCHVEYELRRVKCPDCGVRVEALPWARPGARHTRDFEDLVCFLAQQMAKTPITNLLRIGWDTVGSIIARVVADRLDARRLEGLVMIGVDEISYRKGSATRLHGARPDQCAHTIRDTTVLVMLEDNLTKGERTLVGNGREDNVLDLRFEYQAAMRAALSTAVEQLTGRTVIAMMSANHIDPDLAAEVFVLDAPPRWAPSD